MPPGGLPCGADWIMVWLCHHRRGSRSCARQSSQRVFEAQRKLLRRKTRPRFAWSQVRLKASLVKSAARPSEALAWSP